MISEIIEKGEKYDIIEISRISTDEYKLSCEKENVVWLLRFLVRNFVFENGIIIIDKIDLMSEIIRNIPYFDNADLNDMEDAKEQYARLFQGNKSFYYKYYNLPLKILEFYNVVEVFKDKIHIDTENLKLFQKKVRGWTNI